MRKLIVSEFVALDGVVENPAWTFPYFGEEQGKFKFDELFASDTLLLGRVTYEGFAEAWPSRTDEQGFADRMNGIPKYVVSRTLENPTWNNTHVIKDDIAEQIARLKEQEGQNILVYGSVELVKTLMEHDLIDEYRLMLFPTVVGSGKRCFQDGVTKTFKLADTQLFSTGVVVLTYTPDWK